MGRTNKEFLKFGAIYINFWQKRKQFAARVINIWKRDD